jgi:hypothetical protein
MSLNPFDVQVAYVRHLSATFSPQVRGATAAVSVIAGIALVLAVLQVPAFDTLGHTSGEPFYIVLRFALGLVSLIYFYLAYLIWPKASEHDVRPPRRVGTRPPDLDEGDVWHPNGSH